ERRKAAGVILKRLVVEIGICVRGEQGTFDFALSKVLEHLRYQSVLFGVCRGRQEFFRDAARYHAGSLGCILIGKYDDRDSVIGKNCAGGSEARHLSAV